MTMNQYIVYLVIRINVEMPNASPRRDTPRILYIYTLPAFSRDLEFSFSDITRVFQYRVYNSPPIVLVFKLYLNIGRIFNDFAISPRIIIIIQQQIYVINK